MIYAKLYNALQKPSAERTPEQNTLIADLKLALKQAGSDENIDKVIQELGWDLEAIRAIALGMNLQGNVSANEWDRLRSNITPSQFSDKVQGVLTKEKIAESIHPYPGRTVSPALSERIQWVKTWLIEEATDEEAKQFLRWATGSTGVSTLGISFKMEEKQTNPYPIAHTCDSQLDFSLPEKVHHSKRAEYETKQGFIKFIKEAMQNIDFSVA